MQDHDQDANRDRRERFTVPEAADHLGLSQDAVRKRIKRHTIEHERDHDGRVFVFLDAATTEQDDDQDRDRDELVESYRDQIEYLRAQIDARTEELRRKDHIIAALTERIPELEPPPEAQEKPQPRTEEQAETSTNTPAAGVGQERNTRPWWKIW